MFCSLRLKPLGTVGPNASVPSSWATGGTLPVVQACQPVAPPSWPTGNPLV